MAAATMAKDCFQTQFASVMEKVLKTAVTETTKLFETTIGDLRAEICRVKEENEDLKSTLRSPENAKKSGESETQIADPVPSQRTTSHISKRDIGVQCVLTVQALSRAGEQHQREKNQGTELHRGAYDEEGNPRMAFVLIKQEVDWEADYSDDYSPGYILLKQEGGEPTLVRRQPLRELPGRALVPPGAVRALDNRYTQERPPTIQPTSATAHLQGDPDTQEVPQALNPSQTRIRGVTRGSAGQDQATGAEQQSLVIPAAESLSALHLTASPQSPATTQSTSTVLSTVMVQSTVATLSKDTVQATTAIQSTLTVKSTAAASERPPPSTPLQDTQPSLVPPHPPQPLLPPQPLRPPRPPRPSPSQSHTDVLPVARPIVVPSTQPARPTAVPDEPPAVPPTQPPKVLEQSCVATATPPTLVQSTPLPTLSEKQALLVTEHVQCSSTVPPRKSPAFPEKTSDEAPLQLSAPTVTTPSGLCQMSTTQFLSQLLVVPSVRATPRLEEGEDEGEEDEEEDEGERLSPLPAKSTEAVTTRSVATETTPAREKKEDIVVQVGGSRKSSRREAILSGLRLRLRPRPQDSTPSPVVAKKPRGDRTSHLDHDYLKVMQNGGEKSSESHLDQDVVEDTVNGVTADDKSSGQGSRNQVISEEEGGANTDVTSLTRQSPIGVRGGVSKSKKRSMTWVQAQRGLALAQAKRSRSKVTKASQRGQTSELRGLVTQTPFLPPTPQCRRSYCPSPHAVSTSSLSPRRTSPRQATGANVTPSPATPPHPQPHNFKVVSATPRRGRPRSAAAAVLNLKLSPSTPQPIPFIVTVSPRSGFKKSPQCTLTIQQAQRYRKSQPMWSPPGPHQLQQSPRKRFAKNQCADCGRILSSAAALESHASLHTGKRPFACSACSKDFPNLKGLNRHARVHGDQRGHQCPKCDKTFVYRFGLTKHEQMVHNGVRPFVCPICDKRFVIRRDMETHLRIHTGEKPFACSLCVKRFKRRVELNVHLRWHNGEKRHWCSYCGKGFLDYNNLKRHKLVHTGEKPYTCSECGKRFKQTGHLKKHLKTVHKDREDES